MNIHQVALKISVACGALVLSGCTGAIEALPADPPASAAVTTDKETCSMFGGVLTVVANADAGVRDGRMEAQEQQGWYRLATRILDRVPTATEGAVSDAINSLKDAAPIIAQAKMGTPGIGSAGWDSGYQTLSEACSNAGAELALEMFTGG
ncbi:hypothetical protein [Salinibacterium sp.]|uniref:hypothetical protein n=1 Tax=Salinibacterium sp. TaxID=1915057 RepID=UPI00286A3963|nr:hypothetical protein [Salinibacterium sp.]